MIVAMRFNELDTYGYETWVEEREYVKPIKTRKKHKFYDSKAWRLLRKQVLDAYGNECMKCGSYETSPHVDHIRLRFYYPDLSLDFNNLQVLCEGCNMEKDLAIVDYRKAPQYR